MRLLHLTTVPMTLRFLKGQPAFMRLRGIDTVVVSSPGEELGQFGQEEHVPVHAVEMRRQITPLRDLAALGRLVRVIRSVRPNILHAHTPKAGLLGMVAGALARVPIRIYHMRGLPFTGATGVRRKLLLRTEQTSCRLATRVICVSHSLRQTALRYGISTAPKTVVLASGSGQGVDAANRFNPQRLSGAREMGRNRLMIPPDALVIGFVGRVVCDKGIPELAEAWLKIRAHWPASYLILAGPIEPQDQVPPAILAVLGQDPRVRLIGMLPDPASVYPAFDLLVLPSRREGFPNVTLEAAAMSLPVVTTRIPGCTEAVVDGETGTLVSPGEPVELAHAIERYLAKPVLREQHGEAGRTRVLARFRPEIIWEALFRQYLELAGPISQGHLRQSLVEVA